MTPFSTIFYSILVPFLIWFIRTFAVYRGTEPDSEQRRKLRVPKNIMLVLGCIVLICGSWRMAADGIANFTFYLILMTVVAGIPLTFFTFFILFLIKWRRAPQDSPERMAYKRKMRIFGTIFGVLAITYTAFIIWFAIGLAHM